MTPGDPRRAASGDRPVGAGTFFLPAMRRLLPAFVQRRLLLSAARRALHSGRPESALEILRDELLAEDTRAMNLRALILPLVPQPPLAPPRAAQARERPKTDRADLRDLLARMREKQRERDQSAPTTEPRGSAAESPPLEGVQAQTARLRMSLDDAGSFLLCCGTRVSIGHARAGQADVPLLADLLPRHGCFVLEPASFQAGASWRLESVGSAQLLIDGHPITAAGQRLRSGARVQIGLHTALGFEQPDDASSSAALELEGGLESAGARRILLFAPGSAGRLSIGNRAARHIRAPLLGVELELSHQGGALRVQCASGLIPDGAQGGAPQAAVEFPLCLAHPVHLRLVMPSPSDRPRWISFSPLEPA